MEKGDVSKWFGQHLDNSQGELNARQELLRLIGNRLFACLFVAMLLAALWAFAVSTIVEGPSGAMHVVFFTGIVGGMIGLQNRLQQLTDGDLLLLTKSWMYLLLAPMVGGFMAVLLYVLFVSGLLRGDLFPEFLADTVKPVVDTVGATEVNDSNPVAKSLSEKIGVGSIFKIHANGFEEYGKLIFWSFVAGFSERFVTRIISRFESSTTPDDK